MCAADQPSHLNGSGTAEEPEWDPQKAKALIGKRVLISITVVDEEDEPLDRWQGYGVVSRADRDEGIITVALKGVHEGEETILPALTSAFEPAAPGVYTLKETGEKVENPDYTVRWTVSQSDDEDDED